MAALLAQRTELQQALSASMVQARAVVAEQRMRKTGKSLFGVLFGAGEVARLYRAAAAMAAQHGERLRVGLLIDDAALAGLPWEAMYDAVTGEYVCRQAELIRQVEVPSASEPLTIASPLRILGIVSSPPGLSPVDVDGEKERLTRALSGVTADGLVELVWAPSATSAGLQDLLLSGPWHVVHFIGHSDVGQDHSESGLTLPRDDSRPEWVEADRFAHLLGGASPVPRLVVLSSPPGTSAWKRNWFPGMAAALMRGGVSAVTTMQYEISDRAAAAFTRAFYEAIAHYRSVDEAVSSGRIAIIGLSSHTLEWAAPVLYLRGHGSRYFTVPR